MNNILVPVLVCTIVVLAVIGIVRFVKQHLDPLHKTGLEVYSRYHLSSNGDGVEVLLLRKRRSYRGRIDRDVVISWFEMIGMAFPDKEDVNDTFTARGLPTSFSIQFNLGEKKIAVLDVGYPLFNDPERKQVSLRWQDDLVFGPFDLIAGIDKRSVRSTRTAPPHNLCAASP
ncbi:MAG TPA: hypothetical protein VFT82_03710 [Candidatus Paceibacterota bacterium]|nr:hypothetical protein [Candidatus Paceibacterota bacterium]